MRLRFIKYLFLGILLFGAFYWFQLRPAHIRKECSQATYQVARDAYPNTGQFRQAFEYQDSLYKLCLKARGI